MRRCTEDDTRGSLLSPVLERLIDLRSLNRSQWTIVVAMGCVLLAVPVLLALPLLVPTWPRLRFASGLGPDYEIGWPPFVVVSIAVLFGETLVLAGSLHGRWFLAGFVLLVLWAEGLYFSAPPVQLAALLITTLWVIRIHRTRRRQRRAAGRVPALAVSCALSVVVAVTTYVPAWANGLLSQLIVGHILGALVGLLVMLVLTGTDFAELTQAVSLVLTERLGSRHRLRGAATFLLAIVLGVAAVRAATPATEPAALVFVSLWLVLPGMAIIAAVRLLLRLIDARQRVDSGMDPASHWPLVPGLAVVLATGVLVLWAVLAALWALQAAGANPSTDQLLGLFLRTAPLPTVLLLASGLGLAWLARSSGDGRFLAAVYLLLVTAPVAYGALLFVTASPFVTAASAVGAEVRLNPTALAFVPYLQATAAVLTVALLAWRWGSRRLRRPPRKDGPGSDPTPQLLVLNLSLQGMAWLAAVFLAADHLGEVSVALAGLLLVVALAWDFLTSGSTITNPNPTSFPRQARIFAYCGYLVLVAAYVLLASELELGGQGEFLKRGTEGLVLIGLLYLGVPRVLTAVLLSYRRPAQVPINAA